MVEPPTLKKIMEWKSVGIIIPYMKWKVIKLYKIPWFQSIPVTTKLSGCLLIGLLSQSNQIFGNASASKPPEQKCSKSPQLPSRVLAHGSAKKLCFWASQKLLGWNLQIYSAGHQTYIFFPKDWKFPAVFRPALGWSEKTPASIGKQEITSRCSLKPNRSRTHRCVHMSYVLDQPSMIRIWVIIFHLNIAAIWGWSSLAKHDSRD